MSQLLPGCMIGPSEPCDAFTSLQEKVEGQNAEISFLHAELSLEKRANDEAIAALDKARVELAEAREYGHVQWRKKDLAQQKIARLLSTIEQMLAETGHGGNKQCGDNRLTPSTVERARIELQTRSPGT